MAPERSKFDRCFKLAICGAAKVGKKSLLRSFSTDADEESMWTQLTVDDEKVLVEGIISNIWIKEMHNQFDAVAIVYATDDIFSFEFSLELLNEIRKSEEEIPVVFIENKIDIVEETEVEKTLVEEEMRKKHKRLYRVSALGDFNVMHPFAYLIEKLTRNKKDVNSNERKLSTAVDSKGLNRLSSKEGWSENNSNNITSTSSNLPKKEPKCIIM